ncbi:MAG: LicD family protein [Alphaproteobacteria bacterium]|nr:LicD family protein [Alphaproteobacteria bacterium]
MTAQDFQNFVIDEINKITWRQNLIVQKLDKIVLHCSRLCEITHDVKHIPPATGHLRLQQRALVKLATMIDTDFRDAGINYFLCAGNLLGAMRTGDFIPWDDDIDMDLMRPDFERATDLLTKKYNYGPFRTDWAKSGHIFKIFFLDKMCVDLFPCDFYTKRITTRDDMTEFQTNYIAAMEEARRMEDGQSQYTDYADIMRDMVFKNRPQDPRGDIIDGIDYQTFPDRITRNYHTYIWRHEYIFPLGEIEFEGHKFMAPNNPDAWLTQRYGDWRAFNPDFTTHKTPKFSYEELQIINDFLDGKIK